MKYKISEIAKLLTKKLGGSPVIKAEILNKLLIESGDLVETRIGKVETKQGESRGIIGRYYDDYWIPYYDEKATEYVIELATQMLELSFPKAIIKDINKPVVYCYSRTMYNSLKKAYQTPYVFLESEKGFWWTYDNAANDIAALLNYSALHNRSGQPLLPFISEEALKTTCEWLDKADLSYVIFGPGKSIFAQAAINKTQDSLPEIPTPEEPVVQLYSVVTFSSRNERGNWHSYEKWLRPADDFKPKFHTDANGNVSIEQRKFDPEEVITDESPLGQAFLGKKCGDKVTVAGIEYEILKIEHKEISDEP